MAKTRKPLPPLEGRRRTIAKFVIAGYALAAVCGFIAYGTGSSWLQLVAGCVFAGCSAGTFWDYKRRTDPARTAGWGYKARRAAEDERTRALREAGRAPDA